MKERTSYIQWQDGYSVGHPILDRQHRFVIDTINELYELVRNGEDRPDLNAVLERLGRYTRTHFAFEEKVLEGCGYPDIENHRALHRQMGERSEELHRSWLNVGAESTEEVFLFLKRWWLNHILTIDSEYVEFLKESAQHGLTIAAVEQARSQPES